MNNAEKPASLSWFTKSTLKFTPFIIELMVIAIVIRLIGLVQPFVFQPLIDRVLPFQRVASLELILIILIGTTIFSATLGAISGLLGTQMANRLTSELGRRIYDHVLGLPLRHLQKYHVGELLARVGEIDTVRGFLTGTISGVILDVIFAVIYIAALFTLSPFLTLVIMIMLPLQIISFGLIGPFLRARLQEQFKTGSAHQSRMVEAFGSSITVKSLAAEDIHCERVSATLDANLYSGWQVAKINILTGVVGSVLSGMSVILVIYYGTQLVFANEMTLGQLIAFHLLSGKVAGPIMSLSTIWESWQGLRIARLRLGDLLNTKSESEALKPKLSPKQNAELSTNHLSFGYNDNHLILNEISLTFLPGQTSLIIGDSGCGKSTLAKLLVGLYEPVAGKVILAGSDISEFDPSSVRKRIAYVAQEPVLFAGSVLDNLLMSKPDATKKDIRAAIIDSASDRFLALLPDGLHTQVGERGGFLSGGQRQRIALARSLLTNPDVLV
jgi:subfamily B ATP-binding cassette protein HlyB/CyaB